MENQEVKNVKISLVEPDREQPRKAFDKEELEELSESIKRYGVIQPVLVIRQDNGLYKIVAGERRWRASKLAGLKEIPVIEIEGSERKLKEIALIENIQRQDLNPIEEAEGYRRLIDEYHLPQDTLAETVSKSRAYISNTMRLLKLEPEILEMVRSGRISSGHGRALLNIDKSKRLEIAKRIEKENLSVRDIEKLGKKKRMTKNKADDTDTYLKAEERRLEEILERKVRIEKKEKGGTITISFYDFDDYECVVERLEGNG